MLKKLLFNRGNLLKSAILTVALITGCTSQNAAEKESALSSDIAPRGESVDVVLKNGPASPYKVESLIVFTEGERGFSITVDVVIFCENPEDIENVSTISQLILPDPESNSDSRLVSLIDGVRCTGEKIANGALYNYIYSEEDKTLYLSHIGTNGQMVEENAMAISGPELSEFFENQDR